MITKEQAEEMLPEEAARVNGEEIESLEVLHILTCKALFHMAAQDKIEMYIGDNGRISYSGRPIQ